VIRWTEHASVDLVGIARWIAADDPVAARRTTSAILAAVARLNQNPKSGRSGRISETRELVVRHLPYLIVYKVELRDVIVLRVLHGAMRWPSD
jgi:addiction module RelE/StbE family toxin